MSYTKNFNPDDYKHIQSILEVVQNLEPGGEEAFTFDTPDEALKVRWLIYNWFYHMRIKPNFRVMLYHEKVTIRRKGTTGKLAGKETFSDELHQLLKEMILKDSDAEANAFVKNKLESEEISPSDYSQLIQRYAELIA